MKTGNILSIAALIICGMVCVNSVNAQESKSSGEVIVNIKLHQVQSIKVLPMGSTVNLVYDEQGDYERGVEVAMPEHLEIFSTGGFVVSVDGTVDGTSKFHNGTEAIDAETVIVTPTTEVAGVTSTPQDLKGKATILSSPKGIKATAFDITYKGSGNDAYINKALGTYTASVTYSITTP